MLYLRVDFDDMICFILCVDFDHLMVCLNLTLWHLWFLWFELKCSSNQSLTDKSKYSSLHFILDSKFVILCCWSIVLCTPVGTVWDPFIYAHGEHGVLLATHAASCLEIMKHKSLLRIWNWFYVEATLCRWILGLNGCWIWIAWRCGLGLMLARHLWCFSLTWAMWCSVLCMA